MEKDKLKLSLLEKIIACEDAATLKKVEEILDEASEVNEGGEEYNSGEKITLSEDLSISSEQEEELMKRYEDYLQNKGKSYSWEEVKQSLRDSHGI